MITLFVLLVTLVVIILCLWLYTIWEMYTAENINGPIPLPLIGDRLLVLGNSEDFLRLVFGWTESYKDCFLFYVMFKRFLVVHHPKYIEAIVSNTELNIKGSSYKYLQPWLGQGLLTASGPRWRNHRKLLTPAFHYGILQKFVPVFEKNNQILIKRLSKMADGRSVDIFPYIALLALDNITEAIMGVSVNAQTDSESKYVTAINDMAAIAAKRMRNGFLMSDFVFNMSPYKKQQDKALRVLHEHSNEVIQKRREELRKLNISELTQAELGIKNKYAFLDLLLLSKVDGMTIKDEHVREEVDTFMFEGHDTTTSAIVFSLYCISKHKDVQEKLMKEQKEVIGDDSSRNITHTDLQQMKYLETVIKESLRMFPSVPIVERMVTRDTKIADLVLKESTSLVINIIGLQRHSDLYEEPMKFRPERFETSNTKNSFDWLAFSAGPRNCIGQKFAMLEVKSVVSAVLRHFELQPSEQELRLTFDLILRSANGVCLKFVPRLK